MNRPLTAMLVVALGTCGMGAHADDSPAPAVPSEHQLMKECMAKQKASDGGMPKEDMKKNCKDVTETERENDKAEKKSEEHGDTPSQP